MAERLVKVETIVGHHSGLHIGHETAIGALKDRLFNVLLAVCAASLGGCGALITWIFIHRVG